MAVGRPYCVVYPLLRNKKQKNLVPNPCIFWVHSLALKKRISRLEAQGMVIKFQDRLHDDLQAREILRAQHERYTHLRWNMLSEEHKTYVLYVVYLCCVQSMFVVVSINDFILFLTISRANGWLDAFETGIGGIRYSRTKEDNSGIKCLHAHYAHYCFNQDNLIGRWVEEELARPLEPER